MAHFDTKKQLNITYMREQLDELNKLGIFSPLCRVAWETHGRYMYSDIRVFLVQLKRNLEDKIYECKMRKWTNYHKHE